MNDRILTAYRDTAAEARDYADPDRAVATARRRRRTRIALVVPAVAAVLGAGMFLRLPSAPPPTAVAVADPVVLTAPGNPEPLPRGAVGPAALVYTPCFSDCDALVALTDGRQFVVPPDAAGVYAGTMSVSPGGAWLGYPGSGGYVLRDLTGTRAHRVPVVDSGHRISAAVWSADATTLLLAEEPRAGGDPVYQLFDVTTGTATKPAVPPGRRAAGILPGGAVLYGPSLPSGPTLTLSTTDGRAYPIALTGKLAADELIQSVHLARNGTDVWIVVGTAHPGIPAAAVDKTVAVILAGLQGKALARYDLPQTGLWEPGNPTSDGFVLSHRTDTTTAKATLVTVSATGVHDGLTIPGTAGGPVVRLPG